MATEGTADAEYAMQVAKLKDFIRNGTPTQAGRIIATLMEANEEVDEFKIRQIRERLVNHKAGEWSLWIMLST